MVTYLLKKSYRLKDLKQIEFQDLWGDHGIFTTMWIFGKPAKILFFDNHLKNLISSLKKYQIINKDFYEFGKKKKFNFVVCENLISGVKKPNKFLKKLSQNLFFIDWG